MISLNILNPQPTIFHFVRHGDVNNPDDIFYGRLPGFPLSGEGVSCIHYTAKQLQQYPIKAIYCSPLLRTKQSAEIIAETLQAPLYEDGSIIEIATQFQGHRRNALGRILHYPPAKNLYSETMEEIYSRMASFVHEKAKIHPGSHVVAVSHGGPIRILSMGLMNLPFSDWAYDQEPIPVCGADTTVTVYKDRVEVSDVTL